MDHEALRTLDLFAFDDPSFVCEWFFDLQSAEAPGPARAGVADASFAAHRRALYRPN